MWLNVSAQTVVQARIQNVSKVGGGGGGGGGQTMKKKERVS